MQLISPLVSIIVATYNRGEVLCQTLQMALAQDYPDFEVIVIDQSPEPPEAVRTFVQAAGERLRYMRRQIPNLPAARNAGVRMARGEIIVFIDDDVIIGPEYVAAHVARYSDPSVGGVAGLTLPPGNYDEAQLIKYHFADSKESLPDGSFLVKSVEGCNCSFRKGAIVDAGMFDESFTVLWDDYDMALRVQHRGHLVIFDPRIRLVHLALKSGGCANREVGNQRVQNEQYTLGLYYSLKNRTILGTLRTFSRVWAVYRFRALNVVTLRSPRSFIRCHQEFARNLLAAGRMCRNSPMVSELDSAR